jgi:hypothetical protein
VDVIFVNKFWCQKPIESIRVDVPHDTKIFTQYKKICDMIQTKTRFESWLKKEGMKDSEDLMLEIRDKRKKGEKNKIH